MKVVSFFAGCGGLDLGFEQAGYEVVLANEFEVFKSMFTYFRLKLEFLDSDNITSHSPWFYSGFCVPFSIAIDFLKPI